VVGHGVGADVHAGGYLAVVKPLSDKAGDGLLGVGQAAPAGDWPVGGYGVLDLVRNLGLELVSVAEDLAA